MSGASITRLGNGTVVTQVQLINGDGTPSSPASVTYTDTTATGPGNSIPRLFEGYRYYIVVYTVASINTNVTVQLEGRITSTGAWVNVNAAPTVITANGTYQFSGENRSWESLRFTVLAETGGFDVTVNVDYKFSA